jgi:dTDP-4-amino-4,6-dideoxygalactose transaminase
LKRARERIAQRYSEAFSSCELFVIPTVRKNRSTSWHLYVLRLCAGSLKIDRNEFIEVLHRRGVACSVHFIPLHLQPYYQRAYGYRPGHFPRAEREFNLCLSLPIYPGMTDVEINHVISAVLNTAEESRMTRAVAVHGDANV